MSANDCEGKMGLNVKKLTAYLAVQASSNSSLISRSYCITQARIKDKPLMISVMCTATLKATASK